MHKKTTKKKSSKTSTEVDLDQNTLFSYRVEPFRRLIFPRRVLFFFWAYVYYRCIYPDGPLDAHRLALSNS